MVDFHAPSTVREALEILGAGGAAFVAGGTDFYPALRDGPVKTDVIGLGRIGELKGVEKTAEGWSIGAGAAWTDIVKAPLPACFDGLKLAAREIGSIQIQNAGTVAGNLCNASPAADGVPPLLTLNAGVELASVSGRRVLPLDEFILGVRKTALRPGEMMTRILIPPQPGAAQSAFKKLGTRKYLVISTVMAAVMIEPRADGRIAGARIAAGACSPVALRLPALEGALLGAEITPGALAARVKPEHLAPLSPISDVRGSAEYRMAAAAEIIRRTLAACCKGADA